MQETTQKPHSETNAGTDLRSKSNGTDPHSKTKPHSKTESHSKTKPHSKHSRTEEITLHSKTESHSMTADRTESHCSKIDDTSPPDPKISKTESQEQLSAPFQSSDETIELFKEQNKMEEGQALEEISEKERNTSDIQPSAKRQNRNPPNSVGSNTSIKSLRGRLASFSPESGKLDNISFESEMETVSSTDNDDPFFKVQLGRYCVIIVII